MSQIPAADRLRRLLSLLPWVASHRGPTVEEVCDRFGLEPDELLSDVALVSMVGVPPYSPGDLFEVVVEEGRVWVHLSPSFDRALRLTPEEALALVAAGASLLAVPGADPGGPLARGLAKLAATLGIDPDDAFDIDLGHASAGVLATIQQATDEHRRLRLAYYTHGRDQHTEREVDPYRVHAEQGRWYLVGFDHLRDDVRLFRVDRILSAEALDASFQPPDELPSPELFEAGIDDPRVVLDLAPEAAWVVESYAVDEVETRADGRLRVTLPVSGRPWLERVLLQLGPRATVVRTRSDPALAHCGEEAAARLLARYESP
ncbi:MAG TPA: WYL domain-containing protein [Acidimicrobiales bacterium]